MNFGVVTQFTMNADPVPARCWSSIMYFTFGQLEVLVPRLEQWRRQEMGESDCVLLGLSLDTETREPVSRPYPFQKHLAARRADQ